MKRSAPVLACLLGIIGLVLLVPRFNSSQPQGVRLTRKQAKEIADRAAKELGIPVERSWTVESWLGSTLLDKELDSDPARRRAAASDPAIGPRLGGYRVSYYRRGLEKWTPYGYVYVSGETGDILAARRRHRNEEPGAQLTDAQLRARADEFVATHKIAGAPSPKFESARPTQQRSRTDWTFRYRVATNFPVGNVVPYLYVSFAGDKFAGWELIEEYADGRSYRSDDGSAIAGSFVRLGIILAMLCWLLVIFLRKYHAGEVGVGTASLLLIAIAAIMIAIDVITGPSVSEGAGFGSALDAQQTAWAWTSFKFLFYDLPVALLVFFAWAVGESYARERWGERLASFEAILRRDPVNATVGRSVLTGILVSPAIAAAAFLVGLIPLALHIAHPSLGSGTEEIVSMGGAFVSILSAAFDAIVYPVVALLFLLAFANSKRVLPIGIVVAIALAMAAGVASLPISPFSMRSVFGIGAAAATLCVFLGYDLLAACSGLFFGSLFVNTLPLLSVAKGLEARNVAMAVGVPLVGLTAYAIVARLTGREVVYTYEDLAPHVKRIIERERVKAEIDAANRIQAALLPLDAPQLVGASVASHYRAATEIGGDYFDFLPQPSGEIGIAFGDVSGHGLTSGIVMAMAKSALLVQVDYDSSPRAVLDVLNEIVMKTAPKRIMMTFFFGLLDPRTQTLRFSSAGHLDPYVYRAATRRLEALSSWGFPLGVKRREPFREHTVEFSAGDRLILYSDGLIEAVDDDGEPFGFDRFERTLVEAGHLNADEIKRSLLGAVRKFTRNRPPEDDQTLVVVSFDESAAGVLRPPVVAGYSEHVN